MSIPIDPIYTTGAVIVPITERAIPMLTCKPPPEGLKDYSFQLNSSAHNNFLVDLSVGNPQPISQISALYIDNANCISDITINFLDTGFSVFIEAGDIKLFPVLTGVNNLKFYVHFGLTTSSNVKIHCLNQFIPELNYIDVQNVLDSGTPYTGGIGTKPIPNIARNAELGAFSKVVTLSVAKQDILPLTFASTHQVIGGLQIYLNVKSNAADSFHVVSLYGEGAFTPLPFLQLPFLAQTQQQVIQLISLSGMNNMRDGILDMTDIQIAIDNTTNLTILDAYCNIQIADNSLIL